MPTMKGEKINMTGETATKMGGLGREIRQGWDSCSGAGNGKWKQDETGRRKDLCLTPDFTAWATTTHTNT